MTSESVTSDSVSDPAKVDYRPTIRLPKTDFAMKANLAQREPETLARWAEERVYERALEARKDAPQFVFHDGPPYANGHIHYGHILNKTLKDIVTKYQLLAGRGARFVPGWDCHGLPIELNVEKAHRSSTRPQLRAACRVEAEKWIDAQRSEFQRLGVFGTWTEPYLTMQPTYEQGVVEALAAFVKNGLVYRGKKPVYWCGNDRTALAEAEVEYAPHVSPSIYVKFPVVGEHARKLAEAAGVEVNATPTFAVIWTTTPWTLPANLAIAVNPHHAYTLVDVDFDGRAERWLLAKEMVERVLAATKRTGAVVGKPIEGELLEQAGIKARHPFEDRESPIFAGDHVTLEAGTGLVHTAPGHGADDYALGRKHGLDTFAPLDDAARFTGEVRADWQGKHVYDVNPLVVKLLAESGHLANREGETVAHSYPHCWRCKKPVIFRATTQWFISLDEPMSARADQKSLRSVALEEIDAMAAGRDVAPGESGWIPSWGRDRIHGMIKDRPDWCISRQRAWGVPIPAFHCKGCGHVDLSEPTLMHVAAVFGRDGADVWYTREAAELVPPGYHCAKCGGSEHDKDPNILDVWFESGASFWSVMRPGASGPGTHGATTALPVDLYLEGSDQHRGWFHSSLLVGCAVLGRAPYKRVLTHGFVGDEQGRPYSKSDIRRRQEAGEKVEYIDPQQIIKTDGAEMFRLWTAYEDYRSDVRYSKAHLVQVSDAYRKVRNTLRFLLGNLDGWVPGTSAGDGELDVLDAWARARLRKYRADVFAAYEGFDFQAVYHRTLELCTGEWSTFYLDVLKDRLYCDGDDSARRRSAQATIDAIARATIAALAPVLCFTADEAWRHLPGEAGRSVFLGAKIEGATAESGDAALLAAADALAPVRVALNAALEPQVKAKVLGHRREVRATLTVPAALRAALGPFAAELADLLTVAEVELTTGETLAATVIKTDALACPRCWRHRRDVGARVAHPTLCLRCADVLTARGEPA